MSQDKKEPCDDIQEIAELILQYLANHKEAADTIEGIHHWWIAQQRIIQEEQKVNEAVAYLCQRGNLSMHKLPGGAEIYGLKDKKKLS